jgi:hypothetical protein
MFSPGTMPSQIYCPYGESLSFDTHALAKKLKAAGFTDT